jgi:hypothetical protein
MIWAWCVDFETAYLAGWLCRIGMSVRMLMAPGRARFQLPRGPLPWGYSTLPPPASPPPPPPPQLWHIRLACAITILPVLMLGSSAASAHRAACVHLLVAPICGPLLQRFASDYHTHGHTPSFLCRACLFLGNLAALLLLAPASVASTLSVLWWTPIGPPNNIYNTNSTTTANGLATTYGGVWIPWAHSIATLTLCLGCAQLLFMVPKDNVLRVMGCTAAAVMVAALAIAAMLSPSVLARGLFQAAAPPFFALFIETTRWRQPLRIEGADDA